MPRPGTIFCLFLYFTVNPIFWTSQTLGDFPWFLSRVDRATWDEVHEIVNRAPTRHPGVALVACRLLVCPRYHLRYISLTIILIYSKTGKYIEIFCFQLCMHFNLNEPIWMLFLTCWRRGDRSLEASTSSLPLEYPGYLEFGSFYWDIEAIPQFWYGCWICFHA